MTEANFVTIPALPTPLRWHGVPAQWQLDAEAVLTFSAGQRTDWFANPDGSSAVLNAPALLMRARQPCLLKAFVTVADAATFDAGVLVIYQSDQAWAKLCLERSPQGQLMVVSVVTKGRSDDCNSLPIAGKSIHFRLAKLERAYAFHYSLDGIGWNLVRHFALDASPEVELGFLVQSPTGDGCSASFGEIGYRPHLLSSIRSGE